MARTFSYKDSANMIFAVCKVPKTEVDELLKKREFNEESQLSEEDIKDIVKEIVVGKANKRKSEKEESIR